MRGIFCAFLLTMWIPSACRQDPVPSGLATEAKGTIPRPAPGHDPVAVCRMEMAKEKATDVARTFWPACPRVLRSPDDRLELFTKGRAEPTMLHLRKHRANGADEAGQRVVGIDFPNEVSWSPSSDAFFINDSEGSGQSSYFRYFEIGHGRVVERSGARNAAVHLYKTMFKCGEDTSVYTRAESWSARGDLVNLKVWISHHSHGCALDPFSANQISIILNPRTGRVFEDVGRLRQRYFGESPSTAG
jgi:hypothetical protein